MKKLLLILLCLPMFGFGQQTFIADQDFEQLLITLGCDNVLDNYVMTSSIDTVTKLDFNMQSGITDFTGLEDFAALKWIDLGWAPNVSSIDVTNNTALEYLNCQTGGIQVSPDLSNNLLLDTLIIQGSFSNIDVSNNTNLIAFGCIANLTSLDVTNNINLKGLSCRDNQLTSLDVSQNLALETLNCNYNLLTSLDVTNNLNLTYLSVDGESNFPIQNQIMNLDVSNNTALVELYCFDIGLTILDVSNNTNLTTLRVDENQLTTLDVSNNTSLIELGCYDNELTSLDVRNGNNVNFIFFSAISNYPHLGCIDVDDAAYSTANWTYIDSPFAWFSTNCATAYGCTSPFACNYDSLAVADDGSCIYPVIWQQSFSICYGDSVMVGNSVYDTTGNYIDTINGCDSIVYTNISIASPTIWYQTYLLCDGESIAVGSSVYDTAGNYIDTLISANGCDSIVNTYLMIDENTSSYDTLSVGASIVWNGMPLNVSGDYSVTLINSAGCDSIVNLNLTVTTTGISDIANSKSNLVKITDVLGKETPYRRNTPLFYIYDDGRVEKRIVIE